MRNFTIGCLAICLVAGVSMGQNPPQSPATKPSVRSRGPSQQELNFAHRWTTTNMPNLHKLAELPDHRDKYRSAEVNHARMFLTARNDKKAQQTLLANFKEQDDIYGLVFQWYSTDDEAQKAKLRENIDALTKLNVQRLLKERATKIEALKAQLADQEKKLDQDTENIDKLVADRVNKQFLGEPTTRPSGDAPASGPQPSTPVSPGGTLASPPSP